MRSFALPWIPHDDVILPGDIQGQPALGVSDAADPLVEVMNRKLQLMRRKHAQTREYMEMNALRGIVKDGAGTTLYNYFTEFGLAQISVDFVLGTAGTNVQGKVRETLRAIEDNLLGESMIRVHALVSPEFFDKLICAPQDRGCLQVLFRHRRAAAARGCAPRLPLRGHPVRGIHWHRHPLDRHGRTVPARGRRASPSRSAPSTPSPPMADRPTCWRRPTPWVCRSTPASTSTKRAAGST